MKIAWVTTWDRQCGIADYSKVLFSPVEEHLRQNGHELVLISLDEYRDPVSRLLEFDAVHFQHEYGIFGGKNPPFYRFPGWIRRLRAQKPSLRLSATAHTVLEPEYRFALKGRGWQIPIRAFANRFWLRRLSRIWGPETWGGLDQVFVHSAYQVPMILAEGAKKAEVLPHFVVSQKPPGSVARTAGGQAHSELNQGKKLLVFGFFTPEKGQDIAIAAMPSLPEHVLTLAGGVRRRQDRGYYFKCLRKIRELHMIPRVALEGYVEPQKIDTVFSRADIVLAPFRATTGSGSLAQALGRGKVIIASDLPLNQELVERVPECLALFESENPQSLSRVIQEVSSNSNLRERMRNAAFLYAEKNSPNHIADRMAKLLVAKV